MMGMLANAKYNQQEGLWLSDTGLTLSDIELNLLNSQQILKC